jgi:hypothetical protein
MLTMIPQLSGLEHSPLHIRKAQTKASHATGSRPDDRAYVMECEYILEKNRKCVTGKR